MLLYPKQSWRWPGHHQSLGRGRNRSFPIDLRRNQPHGHLGLRLLAPELRDQIFLLLKLLSWQCVCAKSLQSCLTLWDPMGPHQSPLSLGFSRQEYWIGLPLPSPRDLPNLGIEPRSPALQGDFLLYEFSAYRLNRILKMRHRERICFFQEKCRSWASVLYMHHIVYDLTAIMEIVIK